jgi:hypothetical protein
VRASERDAVFARLVDEYSLDEAKTEMLKT